MFDDGCDGEVKCVYDLSIIVIMIDIVIENDDEDEDCPSNGDIVGRHYCYDCHIYLLLLLRMMTKMKIVHRTVILWVVTIVTIAIYICYYYIINRSTSNISPFQSSKGQTVITNPVERNPLSIGCCMVICTSSISS